MQSMIRRSALVALLACGCARGCGGAATSATVRAEPTSPVASSLPKTGASSSYSGVDAAPPAVVFRTISESYVGADEDAGRRIPLAKTTMHVELGGARSGDVVIDCLHPTPSEAPSNVKAKLVGVVSCYMSGETDFLGVVEKSPGTYVVVSWVEEEGGPSPDGKPTLSLDQLQTVAKLDARPRVGGPVVVLASDGGPVRP